MKWNVVAYAAGSDRFDIPVEAASAEEAKAKAQGIIDAGQHGAFFTHACEPGPAEIDEDQIEPSEEA